MTKDQIFELVEACYDGLPLALVEVWPQRGDLVLGPGDVLCEEVWSEKGIWRVLGLSGGQLSLGRGKTDRWGSPDEYASMRHSVSNDGLFWSEIGERDGYALQLLTPLNPPGSRRWRVVWRRDKPEVHALEVVSTTEQAGPYNRPRST